MLLVLIGLAVMLESIPIPIQKLTSTLLLGLPIGAMVVYGPAAAILTALAAQLITGFLIGLRPRVATIFFNAGQYSLSVLGMVGMYETIIGFSAPRTLSWSVSIGVCLGAAAFVVLNHGLVHGLHAVRRVFEAKDILETLKYDGISVVVVLPFSFSMIALWEPYPILAPLTMVPIFILGQTLRMYRKSVLLRGIYASTASLTNEFDTDVICDEVARVTRHFTSADGVVVYMATQDGTQLIPMVVDPLDRVKEVGMQPISASTGGIVWHVVQDGQWQYLPRVRRDPRKNGLGVESVAESMAVFPLQARGVTQGVVVCYSGRPHAFNELIQYIAVMASQLSVLLTNASLYQQLQDQSWRDGATGLFNYRYFYEVLANRMLSAIEQNRDVSVAIVDVDFFKKVNDTYGHLAGDAVLQSLGQLLTELAGPDAVVARYGGEEFGIILPMDSDQAYQLLERIRHDVSHRVISFGEYQLMGITVSIGVASCPSHGSDDRDILLKADSAMYWGAKQQGRNRTAVYSPNMDAQLFVDSLTGLHTHHFINICVREEFTHGIRRWGVICIDLVGFERINRQFSFATGDQVLRQTSVVIKECLRHAELACRYGGDEFIVVFPNISLTELEVVAQRIDKAISTYGFVCDENVVTYIRTRYTAECYEDLEVETDLFTRINASFAALNEHAEETFG